MDLAARLARAEDRLAFFASFDRLIQDNVSQAGQLMRDALELRERTQAELAEARVVAEARVAAERERYRGDLAAVHNELVRLQAVTAAMARRVAATLGELSAGDSGFGSGVLASSASAVASPAGVDTGRRDELGVMTLTEDVGGVEPAQSEAAAEAGATEAGIGDEPAVVTASERSIEAGTGVAAAAPVDGASVDAGVAEGAAVGDADEAEAVEAVIAAASDLETEGRTNAPDGGGDAVTDAVDAEMAALGTGGADAAERVETAEPDGSTGRDERPDTGEEGGSGNRAARFPVGTEAGVDPATNVARDELVAIVPEAGPVVARAVMVLVHGVPRAAAALSLQRHLHGLRHVESVEAREYAEGVLRLQVMTGETLGLDDLRAWDGGAGLEPVTVTSEVIEVRLPGAHGF